MDLKEVGCDSVDWIYLLTGSLWACKGVPQKAREFSDQLNNH
jgi:hypothetical protein